METVTKIATATTATETTETIVSELFKLINKDVDNEITIIDYINKLKLKKKLTSEKIKEIINTRNPNGDTGEYMVMSAVFRLKYHVLNKLFSLGADLKKVSNNFHNISTCWNIEKIINENKQKDACDIINFLSKKVSLDSPSIHPTIYKLAKLHKLNHINNLFKSLGYDDRELVEYYISAPIDPKKTLGFSIK